MHLSQVHLYFEYDAMIHYRRPHKREPQGYKRFCTVYNHFVGNEKSGCFAYLTSPESDPAGKCQCALPTIQAPTFEFILGPGNDIRSTVEQEGDWELT